MANKEHRASRRINRFTMENDRIDNWEAIRDRSLNEKHHRVCRRVFQSRAVEFLSEARLRDHLDFVFLLARALCDSKLPANALKSAVWTLHVREGKSARAIERGFIRRTFDACVQ